MCSPKTTASKPYIKMIESKHKQTAPLVFNLTERLGFYISKKEAFILSRLYISGFVVFISILSTFTISDDKAVITLSNSM